MLTIILTVLSGLASSLTGFLGSKYTNLITVSGEALAALVAAFKSGGTWTNEVAAAIAALETEAQAVVADTSADPALVMRAQGILRLLEYASQGLAKAEAGEDPGDLPVPPPVV